MKDLKLPNYKNIAVIGAGAVGGFYGAKLQNFGYKTTFQSGLMKSKKVQTLKIMSIWGDFTIPSTVVSEWDGKEKFDFIILSSKIISYDRDIRSFCDALDKIIHKTSVILVLQNGINIEEAMGKKYPTNPILGGLAFTCINRLRADTISHIDFGLIRMGALRKEDRKICQSTVRLFNEAGIQTEYLPNLRKGRYEKLLWNIPFNSLSVLFQSTTEKLVLHETTEVIARKLMKETLSIARSEKAGLPGHFIEVMIERTKKMKPYKTSMLLDFESGKEMEIEAILGEPLRIAQKNKVSSPYLEMMYYQLKHLQNNHPTLT